jgi:hypothetical protein
VDPGLGFENLTGRNRLPAAYTLRYIDDMATELRGLFQLTDTTPAQIRTGGVDLAALNAHWWLPDGFDWDEAFGTAADLWGTAVSDVWGGFGIGASEYKGF